MTSESARRFRLDNRVAIVTGVTKGIGRAIAQGLAELDAMTSEYWRKVFSVNVEGPLRMSQCVAPVMHAGGGGSIVNIASTAASAGGTGTAAYAASKAALVNLTKSMAPQLGRLEHSGQRRQPRHLPH